MEYVFYVMGKHPEIAGEGCGHYPENGFCRIKIIFFNIINKSIGDYIERKTLTGIVPHTFLNTGASLF